MKLKRVIAAIVLVSAFAAPLAAGTFEDAVDAHARGDYAKALRLIRPLANDGQRYGPVQSRGNVFDWAAACSRTIQPPALCVSESCSARLCRRPIQSRDPVSRRSRRDAGLRRGCYVVSEGCQTKATPSPSFYSGTNTHSEKAYRKTISER